MDPPVGSAGTWPPNVIGWRSTSRLRSITGQPMGSTMSPRGQTAPSSALDEAEIDYVRRQAAMGGATIRWASQNPGDLIGIVTRGELMLGAGLGTAGEALNGLWRVAGRDARLADLRAPLAELTRCWADLAIARVETPEEASTHRDPSRVEGAVFRSDITQIDDQQHVLSALVRATAVVEAST